MSLSQRSTRPLLLLYVGSGYPDLAHQSPSDEETRGSAEDTSRRKIREFISGCSGYWALGRVLVRDQRGSSRRHARLERRSIGAADPLDGRAPVLRAGTPSD